MRRAAILATVALLASWGTLAAPPRAPADQPVLVTRALDGDTVVVAGVREHIRLASIEAPEISHGRRRPGQPYGQASREWLEHELVGRADVRMRCFEDDGFGRPVCEFHRAGRNVNTAEVRAGLAWANTARKRYVRDRAVLDEERAARAAQRGLWADPKPIAPWLWRRQCWERASCEL